MLFPQPSPQPLLTNRSWVLQDGESYSEIDIVEGISLNSANEVSLFTSTSPCTMEARASTGTDVKAQCHYSESQMNGSPDGCGATAAEGSFGAEFNKKGGGIFALLLEPDIGIRVWHFERSKIPIELCAYNSYAAVNPGSWGTPVLNFGPGNCNIKEAFRKLQIVSSTYDSTPAEL